MDDDGLTVRQWVDYATDTFQGVLGPLLRANEQIGMGLENGKLRIELRVIAYHDGKPAQWGQVRLLDCAGLNDHPKPLAKVGETIAELIQTTRRTGPTE